MSNFLYRNPRGFNVTRHSYSGGQLFRFCAHAYFQKRVKGWKEKDIRASTYFGNAIEAAIRHHVENNLTEGVDYFAAEWLRAKEVPDMKYSAKEESWEALDVMGRHMLQLFERWWPNMGFEEPKFQLRYLKEMFPNDPEYSGLEFDSFTDLRVKHLGEPLIIDIKTSGTPITSNPAMLQLDSQLGDYAWATGIPNIAFLNLIKGGNSFSRGDRATVLSTSEEMVVLVAAENTATLLPEELYDQYDKEQSGVKGNALKALKEKYSGHKQAKLVELSEITKVRLQFIKTKMDQESIEESGQIEAQTAVDIAECNKSGVWPKTGKGIRFPANNCTVCDIRGICSKNDRLRDELLVNISPEPAKQEEVVDDWLEELRSE